MKPSILLAPLLLLTVACSSGYEEEAYIDDTVSDKADSSPQLRSAGHSVLTASEASGPHVLNYSNEQVDLDLTALLTGAKIAGASESFWTEVRGHVIYDMPANSNLTFSVDGPDVTIMTRRAEVGALSVLHHINDVTIQTGSGGNYFALIVPREINANSTSISYSITASVETPETETSETQ